MCTRNELNIILQKMAQIYRSVYGEELVQVILYGSYARGDYSHDSDVDLVALGCQCHSKGICGRLFQE